MNLEPQKFFIGVIDFFSILMPDALLVYLVRDHAGSFVLGSPSSQCQDVELWAIILFVSYLITHIVFLISANLGDWLYGPLRGPLDCQSLQPRI